VLENKQKRHQPSSSENHPSLTRTILHTKLVYNIWHSKDIHKKKGEKEMSLITSLKEMEKINGTCYSAEANRLSLQAFGHTASGFSLQYSLLLPL
jgi:hypothetical protein